MLSQRLANIVFAILVLIGAAYFAYVAQGFAAAGLLASSGLPSSFFPHLMLGGIAICAAGVIFVYATRGTAEENEKEFVYAAPLEAARGLLTLVALIVAYVIWSNFGFIAMAAFLGPATCLTMGVRSPIIYGVVLALAGFVYLIFTVLLGTQF